jgi:hypothetical protein
MLKTGHPRKVLRNNLFSFFGAKKNFGQFGIVIWNGTSSFDSFLIFKMLKKMRIIL